MQCSARTTVVEALDARPRGGPAAIVLDIRFPAWTVGRCSTGLKADPATRTSRWWWCRSSTSGRVGSALGAAAYLLKPVRRDDLLEALGVRGVDTGLDSVGGGAP